VLSDTNTQVRLEAVKALAGVYRQVDYIGTLNPFTERFKPRLIEMATGDTELSVRVAVIQVLEAIYNHSLLEDEEREKLCLLVFDEEAKVRRAVSGFVKGVWTEDVEERLVGKKAGDVMTARVGVKVLAMLMVKWGKTLDKTNREGEEEEEEMDGSEDSMQGDRVKDVAGLVKLGQKGRTALAVEALWHEVEPISDWEGLLEVLLLDHSAVGENANASPRKRRANGKAHADDDAVDEAWRLEEVEETILLEVLVAALRWVKVEASSTKKVGNSIFAFGWRL
jgi:cohesin complex subunit SA-1/2